MAVKPHQPGLAWHKPRPTLQRGIDRRELARGSDMDLILDSLYGPIYMRFLIRHDELTEDFADQLCALVLDRRN